GRSDWSTKLIRGLTSEAAAGFRSRRGPSHDSTLVTPHNAPFSTYKAARVHHASRRSRGVAARGARAAAGDAGDRSPQQPVAGRIRPRGDWFPSRLERGWLRRGTKRAHRISLGGGPI